MNTVLEICGGGGGQALGLEQAGFEHAAIAEIDPNACATLRLNRPGWKVIEGDIRDLEGREFRGVDLVAGGPPCPPFTVAGHQLGAEDGRDLFPTALRIVDQARPKAVLLENVPGLKYEKFDRYRASIAEWLHDMGYLIWWRIIQSSDFGVPQLRPRMILIAIRQPWYDRFEWPLGCGALSVGEALFDLMGAGGWPGAFQWACHASDVAPTIVGGSKKHGGPDLGPTRAREAWKKIGVDGRSIAAAPPGPDHQGLVRLTLRMTARIQGFPDDWEFSGRKTAAYRQIGNAFPPPVAYSLGTAIRQALG